MQLGVISADRLRNCKSGSAEHPDMGAFAVKERLLSWPGDLVIAGLAVVLGFLVAAGFVPLRGRGSSWSARSP